MSRMDLYLYYSVVTGLVSIHQLAVEETQQHTLEWLRDHRCSLQVSFLLRLLIISYLIDWFDDFSCMQCICTVLIKPKDQNIPIQNISVNEKLIIYIFSSLHPPLSHFGPFTLIVNHGAIYRRCKKKMLPENQWQPSFQK